MLHFMMLPTRVQGTRLPYMFPPHYLLNATFHDATNQSSGHQTTIHVSTPLLAHFMLNVGCYQPEFRDVGCYQPEFRAPDYHTRFHPITCTFHAERWMLPTRVQGRWMLPTRVQGTRIPYMFPPHYLMYITP